MVMLGCLCDAEDTRLLELEPTAESLHAGIRPLGSGAWGLGPCFGCALHPLVCLACDKQNIGLMNCHLLDRLLCAALALAERPPAV